MTSLALADATGAPERRRGRTKWLAASLLAMLACATAFLGYIGWFGGPLYTVVPAAAGARPRVAAVLLSGDMGFRIGMGPAVATRLAAHGIPVVGVNSLTYFRRARSMAEAAVLIEGGIARAQALVPAGAKVVLVGQSLGADMLQLGLAALPANERDRIALVVLVVPGRTVRLEASPSELFPMTSPEFSGLATAARLNWTRLVCVQGAEEADSLCPLLTQPNARRIVLPGGHPLHRDADRLTATLLRAIAGAARVQAGAGK